MLVLYSHRFVAMRIDDGTAIRGRALGEVGRRPTEDFDLLLEHAVAPPERDQLALVLAVGALNDAVVDVGLLQPLRPDRSRPGVTGAQMELLDVLADGPITSVGLADSMHCDPSNVTRLLDRLAELPVLTTVPDGVEVVERRSGTEIGGWPSVDPQAQVSYRVVRGDPETVVEQIREIALDSGWDLEPAGYLRGSLETDDGLARFSAFNRSTTDEVIVSAWL